MMGNYGNNGYLISLRYLDSLKHFGNTTSLIKTAAMHDATSKTPKVNMIFTALVYEESIKKSGRLWRTDRLVMSLTHLSK